MRKVTIVFLSVAFMAMIAQGQELISKKGFTILPEAGDVVLGFDAVPFFDYALNVVNIMNNTGQTSQHPGYVSGFSSMIVGKYFLEDDMAARVKFGINSYKMTESNFFDTPADVILNPADPDLWGESVDIFKSSWSEIIIGGGVELRRGHNRVQGFYGGELLLGFESSSSTADWGVEMNEIAILDGYWNYDGSPVSDPRILNYKSGTDLTIGLRGFVGVEYFFAPKISVAGEFGWGFGYTSSARGEVEIESWDAVDNVRETTVTEGPLKESSWGFGVDDGSSRTLAPSAALTLLFHF